MNIRACASLVLLVGAAYGQAPRVIEKRDPEMPEEARRAGVNADLLLTLTVNAQGNPENIRVARGAGFGLDEEAVRTVGAWRFSPGQTTESKVEIKFRLIDAAREGQQARLTFSLPDGVMRPELLMGKIPVNPAEPGPASVRVEFSLAPEGSLRDLSVLEAKPASWAVPVLEAMSAWRFRGPESGQAVHGVFEISRGIPVPGTGTPLVNIPSETPDDASLPAPKLLAPADGSVFSVYPRHTECRWEASPGAVRYILEWDYQYNGIWHSDDKKFHAGVGVDAASGSFDFVGAQPGRWRVWPVSVEGKRGNPSEWRTFTYTR